jgi:H+/Cl- antiporter ClcA
MVAILLGLKMVVILAVLRGGAEGGLLTPGLAVGGLASLLLCALWQSGFPAEMKAVSLWWGQPRFSPPPCRCR